MKKQDKKVDRKFSWYTLIAPGVILIMYILYIYSMAQGETLAATAQEKTVLLQKEVEGLSKEEAKPKIEAFKEELEKMQPNKALTSYGQFLQPYVDRLSPFVPHCLSKAEPCIYYSSKVTQTRKTITEFTETALFSETSREAGFKDIVGTGVILILEALALSMFATWCIVTLKEK